METQSRGFFWPSYADLMTSLFVIMLVLFILSFKLFKDRQRELVAQNEKLEVIEQEYNKIKEIETALMGISGEFFQYDSVNKRHELAVQVEFDRNSYYIKPKYHKQLQEAGRAIKEAISDVEPAQDVRYLIIIEGMAARYGDVREKYKNNLPVYIDHAYQLSYQRALALQKFWDEKIDFSGPEYEVIVAGSGFYGKGRYDPSEEEKNKRFLIQIIPKVGKI
jgi:outer membrane protein OmpA-like peptidoglycan-associated protein